MKKLPTEEVMELFGRGYNDEFCNAEDEKLSEEAREELLRRLKLKEFNEQKEEIVVLKSKVKALTDECRNSYGRGWDAAVKHFKIGE